MERRRKHDGIFSSKSSFRRLRISERMRVRRPYASSTFPVSRRVGGLAGAGTTLRRRNRRPWGGVAADNIVGFGPTVVSGGAGMAIAILFGRPATDAIALYIPPCSVLGLGVLVAHALLRRLSLTQSQASTLYKPV